jgi:hypothetical protein
MDGPFGATAASQTVDIFVIRRCIMKPGVLKRLLVLSCILVLFPFLTRANVLSASLSESLIKAKPQKSVGATPRPRFRIHA